VSASLSEHSEGAHLHRPERVEVFVGSRPVAGVSVPSARPVGRAAERSNSAVGKVHFACQRLQRTSTCSIGANNLPISSRSGPSRPDCGALLAALFRGGPAWRWVGLSSAGRWWWAGPWPAELSMWLTAQASLPLWLSLWSWRWWSTSSRLVVT